MDLPVLTLVVVLLFAIIVESQQFSKSQLPEPPESPSPRSLPPLDSSTPSPLTQPRSSSLRRPPKKAPSPDVTESGNHRLKKDLNSSAEKDKAGKKIGLIFVGVASFLQVCIVAFLLISRRQLSRTQNGYRRT